MKVPWGPKYANVKQSGDARWVTRGKDSDVDADALRGLLFDVASGRVDPDQAVRRLQRLPFVDVGLARMLANAR